MEFGEHENGARKEALFAMNFDMVAEGMNKEFRNLRR